MAALEEFAPPGSFRKREMGHSAPISTMDSTYYTMGKSRLEETMEELVERNARVEAEQIGAEAPAHCACGEILTCEFGATPATMHVI
jgi:hypothetical protein